MLYWSLMFLFVALTAGLLGFVIIAFTVAVAPKISRVPYPRARWDAAAFVSPWFRRTWVAALTAARRIRSTPLGRLHWNRGVLYLVICTTVITVALVGAGVHH